MNETNYFDLYTRGLEGQAAGVIREQYAGTITRIRGELKPYWFTIADCDEIAGDSSRLPVALLAGGGLRIEAFTRAFDMRYALRNASADELHLIVDGRATLETGFGILQVSHGDVVVIPRSISYRFVHIAAPIRDLILTTSAQLEIDPPDAPASLDPERHVDVAAPYESPEAALGEYEVVVRHGEDHTSYFYDRDPLPCISVQGSNVVRRFNVRDIGLPTVTGTLPQRLIHGDDGHGGNSELVICGVGNTKFDRPPLHNNAGCHELTVLMTGEALVGGACNAPGTLYWSPASVPHHAPAGLKDFWRGLLVETKSDLAITAAGRKVAQHFDLATFGNRDSYDTAQFGNGETHPSGFVPPKFQN